MKVYDKEEIIKKLSFALGAQVNIDWINRLYVVLNPAVKDGKYNTDQIIEYNQYGNESIEGYMRKWVIQQLEVTSRFIETNDLFDLLTYNIKDLKNNNFLLIIQPITLQETLNNLKKASIECLIIILLVILAIIFIL